MVPAWATRAVIAAGRIGTKRALSAATAAYGIAKSARSSSRGRQRARKTSKKRSPSSGKSQSPGGTNYLSATGGKSVPRDKYSTRGYNGRSFNKAKKKNVSQFRFYANKGFVDTYETSGTLSDPDCLYLGHVAQNKVHTMRTMIRALFRKLLMITVRYQGTSASDVIPGFLFGDTGTVYKYVLLQRNSDDNTVTVLQEAFSTTTTNHTIQALTGTFIGSFIAYTTTQLGAANNKLSPFKLQLYQKDGNVTDFWNFQGELNLEDEKVNIISISDMKVQNRTKSGGADTNIESVNNNPLIGKRYYCDGLPRTKIPTSLAAMSVGGVILRRGAQIGFGEEGKEPFLAGNFVNCKKSAGITLQPGEIKSGRLVYKTSCLFLKYLLMMKWQEDDVGLFHHNLGACEMYALEDMINVDISENIALAYERNCKVGVCFTTHRNNFSVGFFTQAVVSNNA